jgi:hypothetical protein
VRTSHSEKGDTSDNTHGEGGSVAVWVDCEVARLRVKVLGSVVCHCDNRGATMSAVFYMWDYDWDRELGERG